MPAHEHWQFYRINGEPLLDGGHTPAEGHPKPEDNLLYGSAIVWLYRHTDKGIELLFQRRSQTIDTNAGKWDISAGGHINYQENNLSAALREAREELGIQLDADKTQFGFAYLSGTNLCFVYFYDYTGQDDNFEFTDGEVDAVQWVTIPDIAQFRKEFCKTSLADDDAGFQLIEDWLKKYANYRH